MLYGIVGDERTGGSEYKNLLCTEIVVIFCKVTTMEPTVLSKRVAQAAKHSMVMRRALFTVGRGASCAGLLQRGRRLSLYERPSDHDRDRAEQLLKRLSGIALPQQIHSGAVGTG